MGYVATVLRGDEQTFVLHGGTSGETGYSVRMKLGNERGTLAFGLWPMR